MSITIFNQSINQSYILTSHYTLWNIMISLPQVFLDDIMPSFLPLYIAYLVWERVRRYVIQANLWSILHSMPLLLYWYDALYICTLPYVYILSLLSTFGPSQNILFLSIIPSSFYYLKEKIFINIWFAIRRLNKYILYAKGLSKCTQTTQSVKWNEMYKWKDDIKYPGYEPEQLCAQG